MQGDLLSLILLGSIMAGAGWARADYRRWVALGTSGLPQTLRGWIAVTRYRLMMRDPFATDIYAPAGDVGPGVGNLPRRAAPRPRMAPYPIPHRQLSQYGGSLIRDELNRLFDAVVLRHSGLVEYKLSHFEKHSQAITLCCPDRGHASARASHGEVAHIHPSDGSMHMIFSEADAKAVIETGWGERHPLAGLVLGIPATYLFIYSPRDSLELSIVGCLIDSSIAHMAGTPARAWIDPPPQST